MPCADRGTDKPGSSPGFRAHVEDTLQRRCGRLLYSKIGQIPLFYAVGEEVVGELIRQHPTKLRELTAEQEVAILRLTARLALRTGNEVRP
jgi:hypothetical protein